jgi:glycerol-3-phosphate responsive antiterminator
MINTNFEKMQKELLYLSVEQLQTLNSKVVEMLKLKRKLQAREKSATLKVGQVVEINQAKHKGQKFIIKKVKRTKCIIQAKDNIMESYNCPISMLIF